MILFYFILLKLNCSVKKLMKKMKNSSMHVIEKKYQVSWRQPRLQTNLFHFVNNKSTKEILLCVNMINNDNKQL